MKTLLLIIFLVIIAITSYPQSPDKTMLVFNQEDYLQKSKNQKTAAWVMLIGGTVATTIGVGVAVAGGLDCAFGNPRCGKDQTLADILTITGGAAMLGSIPLFIAAGRNKKKALSVSIGTQPIPGIFKNSLAYKTVTSITFKIGL